MARFGVGFSLVLAFVSFSVAQSDPAAGLIPFSTHAGGQVDSLDLATGNVTITIPIRDKIGKVPFSFSLVGNSHHYTYPNINNHNIPSWASGGNAGMFPGSIYVGFWLTQVPAAGAQALTPQHNQATYKCNGNEEGIQTGFFVRDAAGTQHPVPGGPLDTGKCYPSQLHSVANDGSGYTLDYTVNGPWTIHDKSGNWVSSSNPNLATDPDGSNVSYTVTLDKDGKRSDYTFTDSLNTQAMSSVVNGYGAEQNGLDDTYTYLGGDGSDHTVTVKYTQLTQLTTFRCSPSPTDIPAQKLYFPTELTLR